MFKHSKIFVSKGQKKLNSYQERLKKKFAGMNKTQSQVFGLHSIFFAFYGYLLPLQLFVTIFLFQVLKLFQVIHMISQRIQPSHGLSDCNVEMTSIWWSYKYRVIFLVFLDDSECLIEKDSFF